MALAPVAYTLWQEVLRYDCDDPDVAESRPLRPVERPRLDAALCAPASCRRARAERRRPAGGQPRRHQGNSASSTAAAPAIRSTIVTPGVETTTGPLGQGCGNSVGMAIGGRWLASRFNRPDFTLFDFNVYAFCSDGDMMEGVASEAASLAGHLQLSNLCWIYDNNHITIDGNTALAFTEDVAARFRGYGWNVVHVADANDTAGRSPRRLANFRPRQRPADAHHRRQPHRLRRAAQAGHQRGPRRAARRGRGAPGQARLWLARGRASFWCPTASTSISAAASASAAASCAANGTRNSPIMPAQSRPRRPASARMQSRELPRGWDADLPAFPADAKGIATRESSGKVLNAIAEHVSVAHRRRGRSRHLDQDDAEICRRRRLRGRRICAAATSTSASASTPWAPSSTAWRSCGLRPFGATFFIFTDYMRPSMRLAALMSLPVIYVFTHDSIGLGEDGPTHQPVEQLSGCAPFPDLIMMRPADANEVVEAWQVIVGLKDASGLPGADPAGAADVRSQPLRCRGRRGARRLRLGRCAGRPARRDPDRHRQRGLALRRGRRDAGRRRASRRAWSACRRGNCSTGRMRPIATSVLPKAVRARVSVEAGSTARLGALRGHRRRHARHASVSAPRRPPRI